MTKLLDGRVAIVTGAGRGIGRDHALSLARHGAKVVVNDLGGAADGLGGDLSAGPSRWSLEIEELAARRSQWGQRRRLGGPPRAMIDAAVETFGDLYVVVNNAGILRNRVLA